jgi:hypothetical protein
MARRAGKAASRRARQRRVQRPGPAPQPVAASPQTAPTASPPEPARSVSAASVRRTGPARQAAGSQLTAAERSEYHYVERDLRDIVILTIAMALLLALSYVLVHALAIVP